MGDFSFTIIVQVKLRGDRLIIKTKERQGEFKADIVLRNIPISHRTSSSKSRINEIALFPRFFLPHSFTKDSVREIDFNKVSILLLLHLSVLLLVKWK